MAGPLQQAFDYVGAPITEIFQRGSNRSPSNFLATLGVGATAKALGLNKNKLDVTDINSKENVDRQRKIQGSIEKQAPEIRERSAKARQALAQANQQNILAAQGAVGKGSTGNFINSMRGSAAGAQVAAQQGQAKAATYDQEGQALANNLNQQTQSNVAQDEMHNFLPREEGSWMDDTLSNATGIAGHVQKMGLKDEKPEGKDPAKPAPPVNLNMMLHNSPQASSSSPQIAGILNQFAPGLGNNLNIRQPWQPPQSNVSTAANAPKNMQQTYYNTSPTMPPSPHGGGPSNVVPNSAPGGGWGGFQYPSPPHGGWNNPNPSYPVPTPTQTGTAPFANNANFIQMLKKLKIPYNP